jgi:sulfite exporter TauE/SafE
MELEMLLNFVITALKQISTYFGLVAVICFALGTLPTFHGIMCWITGSIFVIGVWWLARLEGRLTKRTASKTLSK